MEVNISPKKLCPAETRRHAVSHQVVSQSSFRRLAFAIARSMAMSIQHRLPLTTDKYSTPAFCGLASAPHTHTLRGLKQFPVLLSCNQVLRRLATRSGFLVSASAQNNNPKQKSDSIPPVFSSELALLTTRSSLSPFPPDRSDKQRFQRERPFKKKFKKKKRHSGPFPIPSDDGWSERRAYQRRQPPQKPPTACIQLSLSAQSLGQPLLISNHENDG